MRLGLTRSYNRNSSATTLQSLRSKVFAIESLCDLANSVAASRSVFVEYAAPTSFPIRAIHLFNAAARPCGVVQDGGPSYTAPGGEGKWTGGGLPRRLGGRPLSVQPSDNVGVYFNLLSNITFTHVHMLRKEKRSGASHRVPQRLCLGELIQADDRFSAGGVFFQPHCPGIILYNVSFVAKSAFAGTIRTAAAAKCNSSPLLTSDFKHAPPSMTNVDANNPTTASAFCSQ
jgi:hypothetical protein